MQNNCTNQDDKGDIRSFSHVIHKVLGVVVIVYPLLIIMHILSELWRIFGWPIDIVTVGGWWPFVLDIQVLRIGQSSIFIPTTTFGITLFGESAFTPASTALNVALTVGLLVLTHGALMGALLYFRALFKELKNGTSPFCDKMVGRILSLAFVVTVFAIINISLTNIIFLIFAWLMYYIFDYGRKLQSESDTTL